MSDLNLISCVNYMKKIVFRLEDFIDKECSDFSSGTTTLEDIEGIKEGYAQLVWVEDIFKKLFEKINYVKGKYKNKLKPIISNIKYTVTQEFEIINKDYNAIDSLKLPLFDIFHNDIDILSFNTWADAHKYYNVVDEIVSIHELGWPGGSNNVLPLRKILFNSYRNCVGTSSIDKYNSKHESLIEETEAKNKSTSMSEIVGEYSYNCSGFKMLLPIIKSLDNMPQNMYYYIGDKKNKKGIYSRISKNVIVKVPMVETVSEGAENSRQMIIKCNRWDKCTFWNCTYAHPGVPYNKIGYIRRCPSCPNFSNFDTLKIDIKIVEYEDIRIDLMYSMSDLFAIRGWCQYQNDLEQNSNVSNEKNSGKIMIWDNLEVCGDYKNPFLGVDDNCELWDKMH